MQLPSATPVGLTDEQSLNYMLYGQQFLASTWTTQNFGIGTQ